MTPIAPGRSHDWPYIIRMPKFEGRNNGRCILREEDMKQALLKLISKDLSV